MITLLVPTLNRSDFILRLLSYYRDQRFQGTICIGDSSVATHATRIQQAIARLGSSLRVIYRHCPGLDAAACLAELTTLIATPYAAFLPDDDLYVVAGLNRCMQFLEQHSDYSGAHGLGLVFSLDATTGAFGRIAGTRRYGLRALEADRASVRLLQLMARYTVIPYCVRRAEQLRQSHQLSEPIPDTPLALELYPACLLAVQGKVKHLAGLFVVHQLHERRYPLPETFEWVTQPRWPASYLAYRRQLARVLAKHDGISMANAQAIVKQALWQFVAHGMAADWKRHGQHQPACRIHWRALAGRLPGLRDAWRRVRRYLLYPGDGVSVHAMLRPSSRYYADFMPIYRSVMTWPSDLFEDDAMPARDVEATWQDGIYVR